MLWCALVLPANMLGVGQGVESSRSASIPCHLTASAVRGKTVQEGMAAGWPV